MSFILDLMSFLYCCFLLFFQYSTYKRYDFQMSNVTVWLLFGVVFGIRISELPGWVQIPPLVEKARAPNIKT